MANDGPWTFTPEKQAGREDYNKWLFRQGVVIDGRGYLRLVDLDDFQCLDAGYKVGIRFCPFCGREFRVEEKKE